MRLPVFAGAFISRATVDRGTHVVHVESTRHKPPYPRTMIGIEMAITLDRFKYCVTHDRSPSLPTKAAPSAPPATVEVLLYEGYLKRMRVTGEAFARLAKSLLVMPQTFLPSSPPMPVSLPTHWCLSTKRLVPTLSPLLLTSLRLMPRRQPHQCQQDPDVLEDEEEGEDLCNCQFSLAYGAKILLNMATPRLKRTERPTVRVARALCSECPDSPHVDVA